MLTFVVEHGFRNAGKDVTNKLWEYFNANTKNYQFSYKLLTEKDKQYDFDEKDSSQTILQSPKLLKILSKSKFSIRNRIDKFQYAVRQIEEKEEQIDKIWQEYSTDSPFSKVKNLAYFSWKYIRRPDFKYLCLGVYGKRDNRLLAWAALRLNWPQEDTATLMDWVVPKNESNAKRILLRSIENSAYVGGTKRLEVYFSRKSDAFDYFLQHGYTPTEEKMNVWINIIDPPLELNFVKENWHYTLGDFYVY